MSLTDLTVRLAKPKDKDFKLADANGLFLLVKKRVQNTGASSTAISVLKNY
jgi:hypothetical protein